MFLRDYSHEGNTYFPLNRDGKNMIFMMQDKLLMHISLQNIKVISLRLSDFSITYHTAKASTRLRDFMIRKIKLS